MRRIVGFLINVVFLSLVLGACSSKDQCSADSDCKTGYACGDDQKCHEIDVDLLFQDITTGQTVTSADDVDKSDELIQLNITVAAQATTGAIKDGTPITLEVKNTATELSDTDAVGGAATPATNSYAGIIVNGFARFLRIPFEAGQNVVAAYLTLSPAIRVEATLTATYEQVLTLNMRYYKGGSIPTTLEGATLDDNDDLKKDTALFQVKMDALTTGYPDGQTVQLFIDALSTTPVGTATIEGGIALFPEITVPIAANIVMRVKTGTYEDTIAFSAVSAASCGFALDIQNDDRFGMADDTSAGLSGLQKMLTISDVTLCSTGSTIEIYIDGTPGTDEPDETLALGAASVQQSITLPESTSQTDTHIVTVVITDDDSTSTGSMTVTGLFIDITPPTLSVTAPLDNATLTPVDDTNTALEGIQIAVTGSAADTLSDTVTVEVRDGTTLLGDTTGTGDYSVDDVSFTATNEALTLEVTARDAIGNETVVEVPLKVYVNDPVIAFQTICARTPAMNMQLSSADDGDQLAGGVQCAVIVRTTDIESASTEVSLTVNGDDPIVETIGTGGLTLFDMVSLPDGEDSLTARVMHLGTAYQAEITVQVDATLPVVTLEEMPTVDGGITLLTVADFVFSCSEANCEYRYRIDSGAWSTYGTTTTASYTALAEGLHTFAVQARDPFGNEGTATVFNWTIDHSAPVAPVVTGTTPTNDTTPTWSWNTPTNTVEFHYSYDEAAWTAMAGTSFTPATALGEGAHTLYVQGRDAAGNWSASGSFTITIDTTALAAPVVSGTTPTNDTTPKWSWDAIVDAVEYRYSYTDGSGWAMTADNFFIPTTALTEGDNTLYVQARDAAGNWSDSGWFTIAIDLTAPVAPTVLATTPTNDTTPNWTWIPVADAVNYRYSYDELSWTETIDTTFTPAAPLAAGTYTLYVQAQDAAGNWSLSGSKEVVIDLTAPDAPVVTGTTPTTDTTPTWSWGAVADAVEYRYSYTDGSSWTTTTDLSFTPSAALAEGFVTLFVQARNGVGTWSGSGLFTIEIDTTAPAAPTVTGITPTSNTQPTWSWDTPTDAVEFRYSYDESSWIVTTANSFTPGSALLDGNYTLYVQGRDAAGNWSLSGSFEITVDTAAPAAPTVTGTTPTNDTTPLWSWNTPAGAVNFRYSYTDGSGWTETTGTSYTASPALAAGTYTLYVQAADATGNWSTSGSFAITIDTTAPTISIGAPSQTIAHAGDSVTYTVTYTGADAVTLATGNITLINTGTANGTVAVTGTGTVTRTVTISAITGDGSLGISIAAGTASDTAGNIASAAGPSNTFDVDNTPPAAPAVTGTTPTNDTTPTWSWNTPAATVEFRYSYTDGSGWTTTTNTSFTPASALAAGTHTLYVQGRDTAGNWSGSGSFAIVIDTTAPTISIGAPSATLVKNGTEVTYTITYTGADTVTLADGNVSLNVTGDANGTIAVTGSGTTTRTVTISAITGDGTLGISIAAATASDTAGNTALAAGPSTTFTVDNTAPAAPTVTGATPTNDTTPTWSWNTPAGTIEFRYSYTDGSGWTTTTDTSYTAGTLSEGIHTLYVQGRDTAGNWSTSGSFAITIDTSAPTVVIDPVNACTRRTTGTISFTVTGATTTTCRFDTPAGLGTPGACGGSYGYTLADGDGTYTLTVTATDAAGNSGSDDAFFSLNTTTPTFQWSLPPSGTSYKAGSAVPSFVYRTKNLEAGETVEIWDADANVKVAEATTAGSLCNATEDISIPLDLPDKCGTYKLYAKVNDGVDSVDRYTDNLTALPATQRTYTFDRDEPVISSFVVDNDADSDNILITTEDADGIAGNGMQATIVLTIQDAIDIGRTVTLRNKTTGNTYTAVVAGDRTATFTNITIPEGVNSFGATLIDCGGNTSAESAKTITVDTTPPSVLFQGPTGVTPGHPLWLTSRDGIVVGDELTGQELKFKITGDWDNATPVVKHYVYDYADTPVGAAHTYTLGEMDIIGTVVSIDLDGSNDPAAPLAYNKHKFEITVEDANGNIRVASRTYEGDPKIPNAVISYPTDELVLDVSKDEDPVASGVQFALHLDLTKLATPTGTDSTIDILAIPITALGGTEDGTRSRKSWNGFIADADGAAQTFPNDGTFLRLGDGFWRLTVKVTDDHQNVYDTALLPVVQQIDVDVVTDVASSSLYLSNDKLINGTQTVPTWLNSNDGGPTYDLYVETDSPNGTNNACINVNAGGDICADVDAGRAEFTAVALTTGGVENTIVLTVNNGVAVATDTYYVRADNTDPTLDPATDVNPEPYVHGAGIWEIGYGYNDDIDHDTTATLELDGASVNRLIFVIGNIEDVAGYTTHGTVVLTAVTPADAIGGTTTVNIVENGADMMAEFTNLTFEDSVIGGQTDIEMLVTITEQPSGNTYTKTIFVHVNLEKPEGITPTVTTDPARGESFVQWNAVVGNNSAYGPFPSRVYEYEARYEIYTTSCALGTTDSSFDAGVSPLIVSGLAEADPGFNAYDNVEPKAAGEAQSFLFFVNGSTDGVETADIHKNGDKYCFGLRANDAVYAQDGTPLAYNDSPTVTHIVDKGALTLTEYNLPAFSADVAGTHRMKIKDLGDINSDGLTDFVVADPGASATNGRVYVYRSNVGGTPTEIALTNPGTGNQFGYAVSSRGDFNGDTYGDVAVVERQSTAANTKVFIFYGSASGISATHGTEIQFGASGAINEIDAIGDFNNDGCDDLAIGDSVNSTNTGRVLVYFGDDGDHNVGVGCKGDLTDTGADVIYTGKATGEYFGYTVRKVGNLNGDAYSDFIVGGYGSFTPARTDFELYYGSASPTGGAVATYDYSINGYRGIGGISYGRIYNDASIWNDLILSTRNGLNFYKGSASGVSTSPDHTILESDIVQSFGITEGSNFGFRLAGHMRDIDGDGLDDLGVSGAKATYIYSGTDTLLTLHPSVYVPYIATSGNVPDLLLEYGVVFCDTNDGKSVCKLYYE